MQLNRRAFLGGGAAAIIAGAAPRQAWAQTEADVIIIGAGLAGLHAAYLLEQAGQRVVVLEGSDRIGGRLHTLDDLPGRPEAGGVQVGSGYTRLIAHAERLGVPLVGGGEESREVLYDINGVSSTAAAWSGSIGNRLIGEERAIPPAGLASFYNRRLPQLPSPEAWRDPAMIAALDRPYITMLQELGASEEAIRLIDANLNGNSVHTLSALNVARAAANFRSQPGPVRTIGGGSQRLPEAMAAGLRSAVRLNQRVVGISEQSDGVTIMLADGAAVTARQAICTIPFSAMRDEFWPHIAMNPPLASAIQRARSDVSYTNGLFFYLAARTPFWRQDGPLRTLWSDDPLVGRVFVLSDDPPVLKVWIGSTQTGRAYIDHEAENAAHIISAIERARPASRGELSLLRRFSWQHQPFAHGMYHHIGRGQGATLAAATAHTGRRLHFAGEHLAIAASGMEGALESGEHAAQTVLTRA
jgi:monoamine oxidase